MEAYGPKKEPRFLYSKHNLHLKYGTESAFEILASRMLTLKEFGYNPSERALTSEEKEAARTLDYADALLRTYDDRVTAAAEHTPYLDSLNSRMEPNCDWPEPTDPRKCARCWRISAPVLKSFRWSSATTETNSTRSSSVPGIKKFASGCTKTIMTTSIGAT